jgi:hypothetical protein
MATQKKLIQHQLDSYYGSVAGNEGKSAVTTIDPYRELTLMIEHDGQGNSIYLGLAMPGTDTSDLKWQIRFLTFDGQSNVTAIQYAEGDPSFSKSWVLRGNYSYS